MKEEWTRARRLSKETSVYWKRFEKVEKEHRKKAEKEAQEQRKIDIEHAEVRSKASCVFCPLQPTISLHL
jgi:DNA helicase INO80